MITAVSYLRVSSVEQVGNTSLDDQDSCARTFAALHGWKLLRVFREEGKSAKTGDRPQFQALQRFCKDNRVDYVIALDTSRFSRNLDVFTSVRKQLESYGTKLAFVFGVAGDTAEARFATNVSAAAAEYDNAQRANKSKRGTEAVKRAGGWTARPPKGYVSIRDGRLPSLAPSGDADAVRRAFSAVASGRKTVTEAASSIGISKAVEFFSRPVFAGYNQVNGELVRGIWEPIVPLAVWYRVQERLKHRGHEKRTDFFLRGHLVCGCGQMLTASNSKGRTKHYAYYHCTGCKARYRARELEDAYREWLDDLGREHATVLADLKKRMVKRLKEMVDLAETQKEKASAESARISRRISALVDLHLDGAISRDEYDSKRAELLAKRTEVQQDCLVEGLSGSEWLELLDDATRVLANFTQFLGTVGHGDLMVVAKALVGSKVTLTPPGTFSNRENDGLYWLESKLKSPENPLARLMATLSNHGLRKIAYRVKIARAILEEVLESRDSQDQGATSP